MKARTLDDRRFAMAMKAVTTTHEEAMFLLSTKAGLRAMEIAGLTWDRVDFDGQVLLLTTTKGDKPRRVPMNPQLQECLARLRDAHPKNEHVILGPFGRPLSANSVAVWFSKFYRIRLGWEGYSSHSGRRTFVTKIARKIVEHGGSLKDVQDLAGHSDIRTTSGYIDVNEDAQRSVVRIA